MSHQTSNRGLIIGSILAATANIFTIITFIVQTKFQWSLIIINPFFWLTVLITVTYGLMMAYYDIVDYKKSVEDRFNDQEESHKIALNEQEAKFMSVLKEKESEIELMRKNNNEHIKVLYSNIDTSHKRNNELTWKIEAEKKANNTLRNSELVKYSADIQKLIKVHEPKGMGIQLGGYG